MPKPRFDAPVIVVIPAEAAADEEAGFLADDAVDGVVADHRAGEEIDMERPVLPARANQWLAETDRSWVVIGLIQRWHVDVGAPVWLAAAGLAVGRFARWVEVSRKLAGGRGAAADQAWLILCRGLAGLRWHEGST